MTAKASDGIKIARGTVRKSRVEKAVAVVSGRPSKPDWLGEIASKYWDKTIKAMEDAGHLSPAYGDFIAQYATAWQDFHEAHEVVEEQGAYCVGQKGAGVYQHPAVGMKNQASDRIMKFGKQLGISPESIKKVQKTEPKDKGGTKGRFFG